MRPTTCPARGNVPARIRAMVASLLLACALAILSSPCAQAEEATAAALAAAQEQYAAVEAQLAQLGSACEQISIELSWTMDSIEETTSQIWSAQSEIASREVELAANQDMLARYVADNYKFGMASTIDIFLESATFEELWVGLVYLGKVNSYRAGLIDDIKAIKAEVEEWEAYLQGQLWELEQLQAQQQAQLWDLQQRQQETAWLLAGLSDEVRALTEQYNAELIAQAEAAAAAAAAQAEAEAAAAAAAAAGQSSASGVITGYGAAGSVVSACYSTPSPGYGLCAGWVTYVFQNAGIGSWGGDACTMYANWCYSSDRGYLQPGMIIAVSSHPGTAAGQIYGHVGVYIGDGLVVDNVGYIRTIGVDEWINFYGVTVTPRWGWLGGVALS